MANRTVKVTVQADVTGGIANLKVFTGAVKEMGSELDRAAAKHPERLNKISTTMGVLGLGASAAFGLVVKAAADFDKQMSAVASVSGESGKALDSLRQAAVKAGKDTAFSATDAARAEEELAKAGVSTKDVLGGGLTGALNLAAAGQMDLADAATIAAQAMNVFHLQGSAVPHIADVLASSANKSAADMKGLGDSLRQGGQVAAEFGLSLEDTVGTLSAFADNALVGSDAGTSLKTMLSSLANPSQKTASLMQELGISAYDASGKFIGIANLAGVLQDKLGGLTQAQRDAALSQIFGTDAMRAANVLYQQGSQGISHYIDSVNDTGAAAATAAKKMDNLAGDVEKLRGSLETMAISAGSGANTGLRSLVQTVGAAVDWFSALPAPVQTTAVYLAGISGAGLLAAAGLLRVKTTATEAMGALRALGPLGEKTAGIIGGIGKVGGGLGLVAVAAFGAYEGMKALGDWMSSSTAPVVRDIDAMTTALRNFASSGVASGELSKAFGADMRKLAADLRTVQQGQAFQASHPQSQAFMGAGGKGGGAYAQQQGAVARGGGKDNSFQQAQKDVEALDKSLANLASNGGAQAAKVAFDKISQSLMAQGFSMEQVNAMFGQYNKAATDAASTTTPLAQGFGDVAANATSMSRGMQDAIDHGETLTEVFKQLNGAATDMLGAEIDVKQSIADLTEKFKQGKGAIDDNTQAGRDNLRLILDSIKAAEQAAQAKYNETGSVQAATETYNEYINKLKQTLHHLGLNDAQVNDLINTYGRMPPAVSTQVNTPGLAAAQAQANRVNNELDRMNGRHVDAYVEVHQNVHQSLSADQFLPSSRQRWGGVTTHAASGLLRDANLYAATSPAQYAFAEQSTGGEAFIPRFGNKARSRAIADYVVGGWLGGSTSWGGTAGGAGGGGMVAFNLTVNAGLGTDGRAVGQQIADVLRPWVASNGGNVQRALAGRAVN